MEILILSVLPGDNNRSVFLNQKSAQSRLFYYTDNFFFIFARSYFLPSRSHFFNVRSPLVEMTTVIFLPVAGFNRLRFWRFACIVLLTCTFECETRNPVVVFLPVTMQDLDIGGGWLWAGCQHPAGNAVQKG